MNAFYFRVINPFKSSLCRLCFCLIKHLTKPKKPFIFRLLNNLYMSNTNLTTDFLIQEVYKLRGYLLHKPEGIDLVQVEKDLAEYKAILDQRMANA